MKGGALRQQLGQQTSLAGDAAASLAGRIGHEYEHAIAQVSFLGIEVPCFVPTGRRGHYGGTPLVSEAMVRGLIPLTHLLCFKQGKCLFAPPGDACDFRIAPALQLLDNDRPIRVYAIGADGAWPWEVAPAHRRLASVQP